MNSQFFQIAFENEFTQNIFITTTDELRASFEQQPSIINLVAVRYSKIQGEMLKQRVSKEERKDLIEFLNSKRKLPMQENS